MFVSILFLTECGAGHLFTKLLGEAHRFFSALRSPQLNVRRSIADGSTLGNIRDGRQLVVPFVCFLRLEHATPEQRRHFELYSDGKMLHWPDLDEDIEV